MTPSFTALVEAHRARLLRAAYGFVKNRARAEEVCQDALLKAYQAQDSFDDNQPFYPWMYRILKNTCLDALRAAKRRVPGGAGDDVDALFDDKTPSPEHITQQKEDARALLRAMDTLDDDHAEVLNLRHFQELSYVEIAEVLGVKEGTVMSRLFRARRALAAAMAEQHPDRAPLALASGGPS